MEDRESMFLLSIGSCLFCFVLLFCIIGMFSLEQRSDRFACKPIIKDLIFLKLGVPSVVVQTPFIMQHPAVLSFALFPWYLGGGGRGRIINANTKLQLLAVVFIIKSLISDPGTSGFLPESIKLWQATC